MRLETNGLLHAIQVLVESAIGKAKQTLKVYGEPVPVSGQNAFIALICKSICDKKRLEDKAMC